MTAAINIAYLELRLSGGTGNTDPNASLGGDVSTERIQSQTATGISNVTGVAIDYAGGNATGNGTLTWTEPANTLTWTPPSGTIGTAVAIDIAANAKYTIKGGGSNPGYINVSTTFGSLPTTTQSDTIACANVANELFDDVSKAESYTGDSEYRCWYYKNTHPADPFLDVIVFIPTGTTPGTLSFGKDPAGVGNGVTRTISSLTRVSTTATAISVAHGYTTGQTVTISGATQTDYNIAAVITVDDADTFHYTVANSPVTPATGAPVAKRGVAVTIANEGVAPAGVTFGTGNSEVTGISLGQLNAGEVAAVWEKRLIAVKNTTTNTATTSQTAAQAYY